MNSSSPYIKLCVNNIEIADEARACIESIEVDDLCDGSDVCTISIVDPNFIFIEDNIFLEDASVYLEYGFNEDLERLKFKGYISAIDISFPAQGSPTLRVSCLDDSHLMNRVKNDRTWENVTRADVVRKIAQEYGYSVDIEPYDFPVLESISQSKQTDIEFLEHLAQQEREPFMCKLVGSTIIYKKKGLLQTPVTTIGYKTYPFDVISFDPQITKENRQEKISKADVNASNKEVEQHIADDDNTSRDVQGDSVKNTDTDILRDNMVYDPVKREWTKTKG